MRYTVVGGNAAILKRQNRAAVLRAILGFGPISRRAICRKTGLTASTMTNIVGELIAAGLVRELGTASAGRSPARAGRREILLDLEPTGGLVLAAHVGVQRVVLAVGDLRARIVERTHFSSDPERGPEDLVDRLAEQVERLLERSGVRRERLLGLAVSTIGVVDPEPGVVRLAPGLGWTDVPLRALVEQRSGLPVVVESSRRAMALAETMFGLGQGVRNFMLVHVGSTIGAGIVVDQRLYPTATTSGGQIGHTVVVGATGRCDCGRIGCLDTVASEKAMARRGAEVADTNPDSAFARTFGQLSDPRPHVRVYRAAQAGDPLARGIVDEAARHLGLAIANVLTVLDLELVLLAGQMVDTCPHFVDAVRAEVEAHAFRAPEAATRVLASEFATDATLVGGLAVALHRWFYAPTLVIQKAPRIAERPAV